MSQSDNEQELRNNATAEIQLINNAMKALWSYVDNEPLELFAQSLGTQIFAHLLDVPPGGILVKRLVRSVEIAMLCPWLRPLKRFWPVADGEQVVVLDNHDKDLVSNWERYEPLVNFEAGRKMCIDFSNSAKKWSAPHDD